VEIDGKAKPLAPKDLFDTGKFAELQEQCNGAKELAVHLHHLLDFTGQERFTVLDLIASLNVRPKIVAGDGDKPGEDLLATVLGIMPDTTDIERFGRAKMAALEVAALLYSDAIEVACGRVLQAMRERGVKGVGAADLVRDARGIAGQLSLSRAQASGPEAPRLVKDVLPEAPVPKETAIPPGWDLTATGVRSLCAKVVGDIPAPVVILGRGKDSAKDNEHLCLAWPRDGSWRRRIVEREVVANAQKILVLAACGLPVNTNNARMMVQYLADFEAANMDVLPMANVSRKLGFQGRDGKLGFLWGRTLITAKGFHEGDDLNQLAPDEWSRQVVHFQGADEGDDQIAAGFHAAGNCKGWLKAVQAVDKYPRVKLSLYAGLTAPLLPILRAPNCMVDYAGETTGGKTSALRVAVSCFGNPDEEAVNGRAPAMFTWKGTSVWREKAPVVVNHLPFVMDDTKHAKNKEDVAETIYMIAQGRGKGRGTPKGTALQETFTTVALSSGEQPATSFTEDGGTRARVITLWGSPFGAKSQEKGKLVRQLNERIKRHYGHAGPRFVQFILTNRNQWKTWREMYQNSIRVWEKKAGDNAIAGRLAACFAAISVTAFLAHKALNLPWEYGDPISPLWKEVVREASDRASAALRQVMDWACSHEEEFCGRRKPELPQPAQGWAGRWDRPTRPGRQDGDWDEIAFSPGRLKSILKDAGFEPDSTIRAWKDRQWLRLEQDSDGTKRTYAKVRLGNETARLVVVTRAGVEAAESES
jgi:hypothetical protein